MCEGKNDAIIDLCIDALSELYEAQDKIESAVKKVEQVSKVLNSRTL